MDDVEAQYLQAYEVAGNFYDTPARPEVVQELVARGDWWGLSCVAKWSHHSDELLAIAEALGANGDIASATPEIMQNVIGNPACPPHIRAMWSLAQ